MGGGAGGAGGGGGGCAGGWGGGGVVIFHEKWGGESAFFKSLSAKLTQSGQKDLSLVFICDSSFLTLPPFEKLLIL